MGVRIKQVEFWENVRVFIPQGQRKLSVIMRCLYEEGVLEAAGFHYTTLIHFREWCLLTVSWCVLWCLALSDEFENAFGQPRCWQRYGFSPVWDRMWIFKFSSLENALLHPGNWRRKVEKLVHWRFVLLIVNIFHPK